MQRDLKVGLSLGVLVLGVVGALLFRREQPSDTPRPTLKTARQLDERIAERPRTPYMTGDVEFDGDESTASKGEQTAQSERPSHANPPDWLKDDEDPFQVTKNDRGQFDYKHAAKAGDAGAIPAPHRSTSGAPATVVNEPRTHVIAAGDSLSALAGRYLGNQGRFQEIYDANRNVLTDPNRLPLGATIVIPSSDADHSVAAAKPVEPLVGKSAAPDKARTSIADITTIEPVSPPDEAVATAPIPSAPDANPAATKDPAATTRAKEPLKDARRFVAPTRLPFSNQRPATAVKTAPKVLDPDGEDLIPAKPVTNETTVDGEARTYQVRKGDSLERIAQKVYGNPKRAADIFAANRSLLASPDAVREGQELVLPE